MNAFCLTKLKFLWTSIMVEGVKANVDICGQGEGSNFAEIVWRS